MDYDINELRTGEYLGGSKKHIQLPRKGGA